MSSSLWQELLEAWERLAGRTGCTPPLDEPLVVEIQDCIAFLPSLDWIKKSALPEPIYPKRRVSHGVEYYGTFANPSAIYALDSLLEARGNPRCYAALAIATCSLDLELRFPAHWRGRHNVEFLRDCQRECFAAAAELGAPSYSWSYAKKVYPEGFFSRLMLESVHWLDVDVLARLAFANLAYYSESYLPVLFRFSDAAKACIDKRLIQTIDRVNVFLSEGAKEGAMPNDKEEARSKGESAHLSQKNDIRSRTYVCVRVESGRGEYLEGRRAERSATYVERNRTAREACIRHYGARCSVCGVDFGKLYGEQFNRIIEVHHVKPIRERSKEYYVDPVLDLRPLCPNCHRMIHAKEGGVYSIEELRQVIAGEMGRRHVPETQPAHL